MDTVKWFKRRSKKLLKAYKAGDEAAQSLFWCYNLDPTCEVGLQKMQHAVAKSVGYKNWKELLAASEDDHLRIIRAIEGTEKDRA